MSLPMGFTLRNPVYHPLCLNDPQFLSILSEQYLTIKIFLLIECFPALVPLSSTLLVLSLEGPTQTTDWRNSSPGNSHKEAFLANGRFIYPSGHWGQKFHYGCSSQTPPEANISLVCPNASFYLLVYLVGYYLLGQFSPIMGRFAFLGQFGNLVMVTVLIGPVVARLNLGALAHKIRNIFPLEWVPGISICLYVIFLSGMNIS
ncbi:hypothetical protein DSO57_1029643 [Entomophthora muscae]|uniref:Uncharacterized protein n=1 Tax=Entomophthora muscae TaxID=34485 RepID=A0ACC2S3E3_9FUNG|nr:hypothetical protein DSO57_1029643 [Entomophthora muscae]